MFTPLSLLPVATKMATPTAGAGDLAPSGHATYFSYIITGLVALAVGLLVELRREARADKHERVEGDQKRDAAMAATNQALAVLVSQVNPIISRLDGHENRLAALESSTAVLNSVLNSHRQDAVEAERRINQKIDSIHA